MWTHLVAVISLSCVGRAISYDQNDAINALYYAYGAYCDSDELSAWDCKWCEYEKGFTINKVVTGNELQAFIGYDSNYGQIVLSFRGTANIEDWLKDFDYTQTEYSSISGAYVHSGFYDSWTELSNDGLTDAITSMFDSYPGSNILVTGHSLGGAVAQIAALELKLSSYDIGSVNVITFGSPRWADQTLATYYDSAIDSNFRIVNENDIVPTVPYTYMGDHDYYHTAPEIHYTDYKTLTYETCDGGEDSSCDYIGYSVPDHLHYLNLYEDCSSSSSSSWIDLDYLSDLTLLSTTDVGDDSDMVSTATSTATATSQETTTVTSTTVPSTTTVSVTSSDDDDEGNKIIYKFKEGLDNVSKVALSIAVAVGWLLAFMFCCCWCKARRDLKKGQATTGYYPFHEV